MVGRRRGSCGDLRSADELHRCWCARQGDQAASRGLEPRMTEPIAMSAPTITDADERAVVRALRSGVLGLGPEAQELERLAAEVSGTRFGVAVSSGTAGLHLIIAALGIGPGDEVLVPSFTFAASINAILYMGARPILCDIERDTFNIDPNEIRGKRTQATRAVMVVDIFGHPADWESIAQEAEGLLLIEDSCEAIGASYQGRAAGSFGVAGCFAFYPNKQITTGEGGVIVTDNDALAGRCRSLRNQGRGSMGAWLEHEHLGYNYRMDELSAALGVSQLQRLDDILRARASVAARYTDALRDVPRLRTPTIRPDVQISWFVYVVELDADVDRNGVVHALRGEGIPSRIYFPPLHRQRYLQAYADSNLPVTDDVASRVLALPFHTGLTEAHVERVVSGLGKALASP